MQIDSKEYSAKRFERRWSRWDNGAGVKNVSNSAQELVPTLIFYKLDKPICIKVTFGYNPEWNQLHTW